MPTSKRPLKRPSKRPPIPRGEEPEPFIPPPPPTKPEGVGASLTEGEPEPGGAEDYYKRIHAHRTVLAMHAERPNPKPEAVIVDDDGGPASVGAQALLTRVFAAEREASDCRERLAEALHERDAARGRVLVLQDRVDRARAALGD